MQSDWTPLRGLVRAAIAGSLAAFVLSAISFCVIAVAPTLFFYAILRVTIALIVTWILFGVVHNAAGMVGAACSVLAVILVTTVMLSHHAAWSVFGAPLSGEPELVRGWAFWFSPGVLIGANLFAAIGVGFGTVLCHSGVPGPDVTGYVAKLPWWPRVRI
ncbi:MAG: hypothetical protein GY715_07815 [Planctomycetes bacterium]|nr:hypothetical protein [Planctomycetota bacterium]